MWKTSIPATIAFVLACELEAQSYLHLTVEPRSGFSDTVFAIVLENTDIEDFIYDDCCAVPSITAVRDGLEVFCYNCPKKPCIPESGRLPAGGSLRFDWVPADGLCGGVPLRPGIYEVRWVAFPEDVATRLEILPDPGRSIEVKAEPGSVRAGEPVKITAKNTSAATLTYNGCCYPPSILDPWGLDALCYPCPKCIDPRKLAPGEELTFEWTPGQNGCRAVLYPGRYRIVWGGFFEGDLSSGPEYFGEAQVQVLPEAGRSLDLSLFASAAIPGQTLAVTATNRLAVPVWHYMLVGCNDLMLLDGLGREALCRFACPPSLAGVPAEEIPPGGSISREVRIPDPGDCGQHSGRWSVIWGRYFGLSPEFDPGERVFGHAEIEVLEEEPAFRRGDCDSTGVLELTDPIVLLNYLFLGGKAPGCLDACDGDDSGDLDLTDAVAVLEYLFLGGKPPPEPFPDPGPDPTSDPLGCERG